MGRTSGVGIKKGTCPVNADCDGMGIRTGPALLVYIGPSIARARRTERRSAEEELHSARAITTTSGPGRRADESSNGVRKSIARVLTVINSKQRQNLREFYKNKKCMSIVARLSRDDKHWRIRTRGRMQRGNGRCSG